MCDPNVHLCDPRIESILLKVSRSEAVTIHHIPTIMKPPLLLLQPLLLLILWPLSIPPLLVSSTRPQSAALLGETRGETSSSNMKPQTSPPPCAVMGYTTAPLNVSLPTCFTFHDGQRAIILPEDSNSIKYGAVSERWVNGLLSWACIWAKWSLLIQFQYSDSFTSPVVSYTNPDQDLRHLRGRNLC